MERREIAENNLINLKEMRCACVLCVWSADRVAATKPYLADPFPYQVKRIDTGYILASDVHE